MKTIKVIMLSSVIIVLFSSSLYGDDDLTSRYKHIMSTSVQIQPSESNTTNEIIQNQQPDSNTSYPLIGEIAKIQALKQDTFESTSDFYNRREQTISEFLNKAKFFAQNASKEYSAGTATMKSYDADRERMQLTLNWNDNLKSLFSEIKDLQIVSLSISKDEAKALFEKEKTHFFHIDLSYVNSKLSISEILIYNRYKMYQLKKKAEYNASAHKTTVINDKVERLKQEKAAMKSELQKLKSQKTISIQQTSFQKNTNRALTRSKKNLSRQRKNYLYICYDEKFLTHNKVIYNACIRSSLSCRHLGKHHFGKYPNDSKAHAAFIRCISSNPKFVDSQGL